MGGGESDNYEIRFKKKVLFIMFHNRIYPVSKVILNDTMPLRYWPTVSKVESGLRLTGIGSDPRAKHESNSRKETV